MLAVALTVIMGILPFITAKRNPYEAKNSAYECGFRQIKPLRQRFDVHFYLISVLFIMFDVEIIFLIPWTANLSKIGSISFINVMFFLFLLTAGLIYEWRKGALNKSH